MTSAAIPQRAAVLATNSVRVGAIADRLSLHLRDGVRSVPGDFFNLCLSLARGIDYAVTNNEVPAAVHDLPSLVKQVYRLKNEVFLQSAIMVLMISIKNACRNGWFPVPDSDELLAMSNEISNSFCNTGDITIEPSNALHIISKIMPRYYPQMKIGRILVSLEAKPGYEILVADFHIPKTMLPAAQEKVRMFVAQTDNMETSSCIISPPQVNFLLNGKGVERRTTVSMDSGPQFPTDVTTMLKYGTNIIQAIGNFYGNHIVVVAFMSAILSSDAPMLQDYVQPVATALASDAEIIEGPSRILLNCPISYKRIKIPVKGHLCRHHQCFDYENFMEINSRKPSWRCPHCNQPVSCTELRIDQNMVKVLKEIREDVADVLVSEDGSWKVIAEHDGLSDQLHNRMLTGQEDRLEQCVDLTLEENDEFSAAISSTCSEASNSYVNHRFSNTSETEDRKPFQDVFNGFFVSKNFPESPVVNSFSEAVQEAAYLIGGDVRSGFLLSASASNGSTAPSIRPDAHVVGISETFPTSIMLTPVLTDAVSPAFDREPLDGRHVSQPTSFRNVPQVRQVVAPENLQLQQSRFGNPILSSETERRPIPRNISRAPIAIQALPAQTQASSLNQRSRTNVPNSNSIISNGAPHIVSQVTPSMTDMPDGLNVLSVDMEWQQLTRPPINHLSVSDIPSSSFTLHSMTQDDLDRQYITSQSFQQVVGLPATSQVGMSPSDQQRAGMFRASTGPSPAHQNTHHQRPPNLRVPVSQPMNLLQQPSHFPLQVQQTAQTVIGLGAGSMANHHAHLHMTRPHGAPVQLQAARTGSSFPMTADSLRLSHRWNLGGTSMASSAAPVHMSEDLMADLALEQNWRPTGRMRGSLAGRSYAAALSQMMVQPTPPITTSRASSPGQLSALIPSSVHGHGPQPQTYTQDWGCR